MPAIDKNRGVTIRMHRQGFRVCQYKDAPGEYMDNSGAPLPAAIAAAAGFDVESDARESLKRKRFDEARAQIEREFAEKEALVADLLNAHAPDRKFVVKHVASGRYTIFDDQGERLTDRLMSQDEAAALLRDLNLPMAAEDDDPTPGGAPYKHEHVAFGNYRIVDADGNPVEAYGESLKKDEAKELAASINDGLVPAPMRLADPSPGSGPGQAEGGEDGTEEKGRGP